MLASISGKDINDFIGKLAGAYSWIGGYRTGLKNTDFAWFDGSSWDYTNWSRGNPDNDVNNPGTQSSKKIIQGCVVTNHGQGLWDDIGCFSKRQFTCQSESKFASGLYILI